MGVWDLRSRVRMVQPKTKSPCLPFFDKHVRQEGAFSTDSMTPVADECILVEEFD